MARPSQPAALVFFATFFAASHAGAQGNVFRGPYLNDVTGDAISVVWESPQATTGIVRYGVGSLTQMQQTTVAARHNEVRLTGLAALASPGSEIQYELEVGGTIYPGRFRTMPPAGTPFQFIVYGDNRSSPAQHQLVVDSLLLEMTRSHFVINTGDMVSDGQSEGDWDAFFPVAAPFLANTPFYVAIGNHEVGGTSNWSVTERIFRFPTTVPPASNEESYYHVVYGNVDLIVVNVEVDSLSRGVLAGAQSDWLTDVLANPPAGVEHRFLFLHQGPYSSKVGRNGNFWLRQWLDDLKAGGVDVIFSGHDHYGERGWAKNGIYYVIHGGGGAPLYDTLGPRVTQDHTIVYGESRLGYAIVEIDGPRAHVIVKGLGGEIVDEFRYGNAAQPACTQPTDCGAAPMNACGGGAWECHKSACRYTCGGSTSLIACTNNGDCATQIGANCTNGTPTCEHPSINPLSWYCQCVLPPECSNMGDCAGRPSPVPGCTGTWDCVDEQCEFTTDICMPIMDGGIVMDASTDTDGAASDATAADGATAQDAALPPDAAFADATIPAADAAADGDAGATAGDAMHSDEAGVDPLAPEDKSSCGCRNAETGADRQLSFALVLVLGLAVWLRRGVDRDR